MQPFIYTFLLPTNYSLEQRKSIFNFIKFFQTNCPNVYCRVSYGDTGKHFLDTIPNVLVYKHNKSIDYDQNINDSYVRDLLMSKNYKINPTALVKASVLTGYNLNYSRAVISLDNKATNFCRNLLPEKTSFFLFEDTADFYKLFLEFIKSSSNS